MLLHSLTLASAPRVNTAKSGAEFASRLFGDTAGALAPEARDTEKRWIERGPGVFQFRDVEAGLQAPQPGNPGGRHGHDAIASGIGFKCFY